MHCDKSSPLARLPATALIPLPTLCELISHLFVLCIILEYFEEYEYIRLIVQSSELLTGLNCHFE